ncbi:MAG: DUF2141 domain-containing protein [Robiginitalea sp.]|jgi:uncharacterized protein (DUF2141 family)
MLRRLVYFVLLCPIALASQVRLEIEVLGVTSSKGSIQVAVYREESSFLKTEQVFKNTSSPAVVGTTRLIFEDLPKGEYALAIFHDENGNDELDTNWMGIPKEPIGFSVARLKTFGPPKFRECIISLSENKVIQIPLED